MKVLIIALLMLLSFSGCKSKSTEVSDVSLNPAQRMAKCLTDKSNTFEAVNIKPVGLDENIGIGFVLYSNNQEIYNQCMPNGGTLQLFVGMLHNDFCQARFIKPNEKFTVEFTLENQDKWPEAKTIKEGDFGRYLRIK